MLKENEMHEITARGKSKWVHTWETEFKDKDTGAIKERRESKLTWAVEQILVFVWLLFGCVLDFTWHGRGVKLAEACGRCVQCTVRRQLGT